MNTYLVTAAGITFLTGLAHSTLGEILLFRRLRKAGGFERPGATGLPVRHVRIMWASWHIVTVMGWGFAALILKLAASSDGALGGDVALITLGVMSVSALIVLVGAKGKHPAWAALLGVAVLLWLGRM